MRITTDNVCSHYEKSPLTPAKVPEINQIGLILCLLRGLVQADGRSERSASLFRTRPKLESLLFPNS